MTRGRRKQTQFLKNTYDATTTICKSGNTGRVATRTRMSCAGRTFEATTNSRSHLANQTATRMARGRRPAIQWGFENKPENSRTQSAKNIPVRREQRPVRYIPVRRKQPTLPVMPRKVRAGGVLGPDETNYSSQLDAEAAGRLRASKKGRRREHCAQMHSTRNCVCSNDSLLSRVLSWALLRHSACT